MGARVRGGRVGSMRVWVADDKPELVKEITDYQQIKVGADPKADLSGVQIMGVESLQDLTDRIQTCLIGDDLLPDVIFLDLSFDSREDGISALKFLKYNEYSEIRNIPVIMYSQSDSASDVFVTIYFRANAYMTKEGGLRRFWDAVAHWRSTQLAAQTKPSDLTDSLAEPKKSEGKIRYKDDTKAKTNANANANAKAKTKSKRGN